MADARNPGRLTRPEMFYLFAAAYMIIGILAIHDPLMLEINSNLSISGLAILVWGFGLSCLFLGFRSGNGVFRLGPAPLVAAFILGSVMLERMLGMGWALGMTVNALALLGCWIVLNIRRLVSSGFLKPAMARISPALAKGVHWEYLFLAGLLVFLLNMLLAGIPILDPAMHGELLTVINLPFIFGFYLMLYSSVRFYQERENLARIFLVILILLSILSTFRSYIAIVFFAWLFLELGKEGRMNIRKALPLAAALAIAFLSAVFIGHSLAASGGPGWALGPLRTAEYRIGFTNHVFDDVAKKAFPWGYSFGESLEKPFGLYTCQALYGCDGRLTSALLGEIMLDFGLPGVFLAMLFTGAVLQRLWRRDYPLYALLMAHLVVALEIGAGYFFILLFAYLGYLGGWRRKS